MDYYSLQLPVSEEYKFDNGIMFVKKESERDLRIQLEKFAKYFKREMNYDFVQYDADEHHRDLTPYEGFLFTEVAYDMIEEDSPTPYRLCGGGCFRIREQEAGNAVWELDWIWIHPFFRHRGLMKNQWKNFQQFFGEFTVSEPLSFEMTKALDKYHKE